MLTREDAQGLLKDGEADWKVVDKIYDDFEEKRLCFNCTKKQDCEILKPITDPMPTMNEVWDFEKDFGCIRFEG